MSLRTTQNVDAAKYRKSGTTVNQINSISYVLIGLCFGTFLTLSIFNDYLFFEWLLLGSFIVFTLIGMHFIGQKQVKRN